MLESESEGEEAVEVIKAAGERQPPRAKTTAKHKAPDARRAPDAQDLTEGVCKWPLPAPARNPGSSPNNWLFLGPCVSHHSLHVPLCLLASSAHAPPLRSHR